MSNRLEILQNSLTKKQTILDNKLDEHFTTVAQANGQPLNDKRNGRATLNKWERQNDGIRNAMAEIEKTKNAIEYEQGLILNVERTNESIPKEILELVESGDLNQWRKHPHTFFVNGVDKARIVWDSKKKIVAHKFIKEVTEQEQREKFKRIYNQLWSTFNNK